jgi:hypothetical protein
MKIVLNWKRLIVSSLLFLAEYTLLLIALLVVVLGVEIPYLFFLPNLIDRIGQVSIKFQWTALQSSVGGLVPLGSFIVSIGIASFIGVKVASFIFKCSEILWTKIPESIKGKPIYKERKTKAGVEV